MCMLGDKRGASIATKAGAGERPGVDVVVNGMPLVAIWMADAAKGASGAASGMADAAHGMAEAVIDVSGAASGALITAKRRSFAATCMFDDTPGRHGKSPEIEVIRPQSVERQKYPVGGLSADIRFEAGPSGVTAMSWSGFRIPRAVGH